MFGDFARFCCFITSRAHERSVRFHERQKVNLKWLEIQKQGPNPLHKIIAKNIVCAEADAKTNWPFL